MPKASPVSRRHAKTRNVYAHMRLTSFGITDVGLRRSHNEDNFYRCDELGLYLVADGMGGHAAGEVASGLAIEAIIEFANHQASDDSVTWPFGFDARYSMPANALLTGIRLANDKLFSMQQQNAELTGMGTTIAALRLDRNAAVLAHVGDSRIYRLREGRLELLTSDHSWVNEQLQKQIITPEEARTHRYKNVITRALGNRLDLEIETNTEEIKTGDRFLLCSDGLSGLVDDTAVERALNETPDLRECTNRLVSMANSAGGHDNITVVVIHCEEEPQK